jgi:hypothetical protein
MHPIDACADASTAAAELCSSPELRAALRYALQVGSAEAGAMFLRSNFQQKPGPAPLLRGLVLACIQPGVDGTLPGYTPSPAFAQTYGKGWVRSGPVGERGAFLAARTAGQEPASSSGIGMVAWQVLPLVEGQHLPAAALVCREWRELIRDDSACQAALRAAKAAAKEAKEALRRMRAGSIVWSDSDSDYSYHRRGYFDHFADYGSC